MTVLDDESLESREELRRDLLEDEVFRQAYAESFLNTFVAAQIKTLREQRKMTQADLAVAVGTKQAGISRLESVNYSAWKTETLRKVARALKVRLRISFETFGSLLDEVDEFSRESLQREKPEKDARLMRPKPLAPAVDSSTHFAPRVDATAIPSAGLYFSKGKGYVSLATAGRITAIVDPSCVQGTALIATRKKLLDLAEFRLSERAEGKQEKRRLGLNVSGSREQELMARDEA